MSLTFVVVDFSLDINAFEHFIVFKSDVNKYGHLTALTRHAVKDHCLIILLHRTQAVNLPISIVEIAKFYKYLIKSKSGCWSKKG